MHPGAFKSPARRRPWTIWTVQDVAVGTKAVPSVTPVGALRARPIRRLT